MSDPIEVVMEEALRPGCYISEHANVSVALRAGTTGLCGIPAGMVNAFSGSPSSMR